MFRMWLLCGVLACAGCTERTAPSAGGFQLRPLASPAGAGSREPNLARAPDGRVVLSWTEPDGAGHALRYAVLAGTDWSAAGTVARGLVPCNLRGFEKRAAAGKAQLTVMAEADRTGDLRQSINQRDRLLH